MDATSESNANSRSESVTPTDSLPKVLQQNVTPNFAEELAKRLGTVRQDQKPAAIDEKNEASINRFKDDIFTPEDDSFADKPEDIFTGNKSLFNDQASSSLWKERPVKPYESNIIPASIDVPPPISTVSTKPKSAIDDLFGDAESDDSDEIFSSKNTVKKITKEPTPAVQPLHKKHLDVAAASGNMATSTPEIDAKTTSFFSDEEDGGYLFSDSKNKYKSEETAVSTKKKPFGDSILGNSALISEIESKISSRVPRAESSGSSGVATPANPESVDRAANVSVKQIINDPSPILAARNNVENLAGTTESSSSSGISIHPPSVDNTGGSSIGVDFQPQMTSTRLRSEEIYRERVASDSLFAPRARNEASNLQVQEPAAEVSSRQEDDVFENEDLFGPPPLPKANSRASKSKVPSLFDDSDSGDDLFSTTSSGSRSQKSTDFLVTTPQYPDKIKERKGLFDEEDIFATKDSPDVDIFGIAAKPKETKKLGQKVDQKLDNKADQKSDQKPDQKVDKSGSLFVPPPKEQLKNPSTKKLSLFDDDDVDDSDLFSVKPAKADFKVEVNLFKDDDDEDLFSTKENKLGTTGSNRMSTEKEERSIEPGSIGVRDDEAQTRKTERKGSDILSGNGLFFNTIDSHGLVFEDDDYDDLFASKSTMDDQKGKQSLPESKQEPSTERLPAEGREKADLKGHSESKVKPKEEQQEPFMEQMRREENIEGKQEETKKRKEKEATKEPAMKEVEKELAKEQKEKEESKEEIFKKERVTEGEETDRKSPPKTLNIPGPLSSPPPDESGQAPRKVVSGKIKNLMGKMGDLKILSPMDTPPLWRRSEEKTDEEEDIADRDSDDGGCISTQGHSSPTSVSESSAPRKQSLQSTASGGSNVEIAISFDEPAQLETLSTAASKTRVRIQAKRRPQSRHARKSALRHSGIDFDTVDVSESNSQEDNNNSNTSNTTSDLDKLKAVQHSSDRLSSSASENLPKIDPSISSNIDDKSELGSLSKESSMKNTLMSPSTDEEDLFDVPPDLPEDPQKEDLFGRAPILSPVEKVLTEQMQPTFKPLRDTLIRNADDVETIIQTTIVPQPRQYEPSPRDYREQSERFADRKEDLEESKDLTDPLRDDSHDPLKDPSQLFAFVTKTPSPEKGKSLLFSEDDSLFSSGQKPRREDRPKKVLDLFADDADGDLFSTSLSKVKKPPKDTKVSLFDDEEQDEEDTLFGPVKKKATKPEVQRPSPSLTTTSKKKTGLFNDEDDNDISLFSEHSQDQSQKSSLCASESSVKTEEKQSSSLKDIFGNQSSEEDIFAKPTIKKAAITTTATQKLFDSDDEDGAQIFVKSDGKSKSMEKSVEKLGEKSTEKPKKPVTRDLRKTAEKIGQDPLSILQDD